MATLSSSNSTTTVTVSAVNAKLYTDAAKAYRDEAIIQAAYAKEYAQEAAESAEEAAESAESAAASAEAAAASAASAATSSESASEVLEEVTALKEELEENIENLADKDLSNLTDTGLDKINQSKALETGAVSTDTDVYTAVKGYKYSSFDVSKFYINSQLTVSEEYIVSGFKSPYYVYAIMDNSISYENNTIRIKGKATYSEGSDASDWQTVLSDEWLTLIVSEAGFAFHMYGEDKCTIDDLTPYDGMEFDFDYYWNGSTVTLTITVDSTEYTTSGDYSAYGNVYYPFLGVDESTTYSYSPWSGTIDLKYFTIEQNDVVVFSGWETGTDTYTIDDETIEIPYTLSKTGSKIVDYDYIESVQAVYDEYGYAPYYTIDEDNETFTLPMGEVYGMIAKNIDTAISNIDTSGISVDLSDYYTKDETVALIEEYIGEVENGTY